MSSQLVSLSPISSPILSPAMTLINIGNVKKGDKETRYIDIVYIREQFISARNIYVFAHIGGVGNPVSLSPLPPLSARHARHA